MAKKGTTKKTTAKKAKEIIEEIPMTEEIATLAPDGVNDGEVVEENTVELVEEEEPVEILEERPAETPEEEIEEETEEEAIELIDEPTEEDKEMVEDVVNIINGLSGIRSGDKKKVISTTEEKETERPLDTAKKEEQGQTFSNAWGGVIYDY